jgi:hypothetical protein
MTEHEGILSATGFSTSQMLSGLDAVTQIIIYLLITTIIVITLWGGMYLLSFKHRVIVRQKTASGTVVIQTKARQFTTKDGITKWRLLKYIKESTMAPPMEFLQLTVKGKFWAEADRSMSGDMLWRKRSESDGIGDQVTSQERALLISQMRRADEYLKKGWGDKILALAPAIIIVMILVIFMMFFSNTVKPTIDLASTLTVASEKLTEATNNLAYAYQAAYPEGIRRNNITGMEIIPGTPFNR